MIADAVAPIPARAQATGSLLAAALKPTDGRWENGLSWESERCINAAGFGVCDPTPDHVDPVPHQLEEVYPQGYVVADECTTLGGDMDSARLRRQAEAVASFMVARELWTGALTVANPATVEGLPVVNPYLAGGAVTVASTATGAAARLAALEQAAMAAAEGQQVFLHVAPHVVLPIGNLLRLTGDLLVTPLGNVIVADAGYPGTGPISTGTSEVQTVTVTNATGGTYTLTFSGQTTAPIAYNATSATVAAALNALSNLDGVGVAGSAGGPWTVTFPAAMGNVPQMTIDGTALTDNGVALHTQTVATTTPGVAPAPAAGDWAYATGPVAVRLTTIDVIDDMASTLDRKTNRRKLWARREFAVAFDACTHYAIDLSANA